MWLSDVDTDKARTFLDYLARSYKKLETIDAEKERASLFLKKLKHLDSHKIESHLNKIENNLNNIRSAETFLLNEQKEDEQSFFSINDRVDNLNLKLDKYLLASQGRLASNSRENVIQNLEMQFLRIKRLLLQAKSDGADANKLYLLVSKAEEIKKRINKFKI